jgi:hypothetical protein
MHGLKRTLFAPALVCVTALFACDGSRDPTAPSQDLQSFLNTPAGNNGSNSNGGNPSPTSGVACVRGRIYYMHHPETVQTILSRTTAITSAGVLTTGGLTYSAQNLVTALSAPPRGDVRRIILHQYLVALVNFLNMPAGTTLPADVAIAIGNANQYLLGNMTFTREKVLQMMATLTRFNEGTFASFSRCGDDEGNAED